MAVHMLDSRDLIDEMNELESELYDFIEEGGIEEDFDEIDRLNDLRQLKDAGIDEFEDGVILIPEDEFEEYMRDYAQEIWDIPDALVYYIDWESFSDDSMADYTSVEFDGDTYLVR